MTDQLNSQTPGPDSPDRYDRILHTVGSTFDSLGAWPDHPRALEIVADAMEQLIDAELEASQRRAIRIQTLLDEQRDRMRKIHQRSEAGSVCVHCSERDYPDYTVAWPCPTIAALEPKETP